MKEDDVGTEFVFTILDRDNSVVDLTGATKAELTLKLGDETAVTKTMTFVDRPNGIVKYVLESGILTEPGELQAEVKITFDASHVFYADTVIETVDKRVK